MKAFHGLLALACSLSMLACSDASLPGPRTDDSDSPVLRAGLLVSGQTQSSGADNGGVLSERFERAEDVVYVSMLPGTANGGVDVTITNERTAARVTAIVIAGGFDPVSIAAITGDILSVVVTLNNGLTLSSNLVVPLTSDSRPKIVRVNPPKGATDVPINRQVTVVVSEPVDSATVSATSVRLLHQSSPVSATIRVVPQSRFQVEIIPVAPLERSTQYTVEISTAIANPAGRTLETGISTTFTTTAFVSTPLAFSSISSGNHTCGLTLLGKAYCWGSNNQGQLGDASTLNSLIPVAVSGGRTYKAISANGLTTCAITPNGEAWCWGSNSRGNLGNGSFTSSTVPVPAASALRFDSISVTPVATCGLATSGDVYCWGSHVYGMLGGPTVACSPDGCANPVKVSGGIAFRSVSTGAYSTCGQSNSGAPYCWGFNSMGELGSGSTAAPDACPTGFGGFVPNTLTSVPCSRTPVALAVPEPLASVKAGAFFACGLTSAGAAYCWGANNTGQHGNGTATGFTSHAPTPTAVALRFRMLALGNQRLCGITLDGATYCWGLNAAYGTTLSQRSPILVQGGFAFTTVSVGTSQACGLTNDGLAYCWGLNPYGALGIGSLAASAAPIAVSAP